MPDPQTIQGVGPWVTLVFILIMAVAAVWKWSQKLHDEVMAGFKREMENQARLIPLIEVMKQAIDMITRESKK